MNLVENILYHPNWSYMDEYGVLTRSPAMVALMHDPNGEPVGLQSTILTCDGRKRLDSEGRKQTRYRSIFPGALRGAAMRLNPAGPVLGVAEGLETALSLGLLYDIPVWATGGAELLALVQIPACVSKVFIAVDHDDTGRVKSVELAQRLTKENRTVVLVHAERLGVPAKGDLNDYLMRVQAS